MIAHTPLLCLEWYVDMRGSIILDDDDEKTWYEAMLKRKTKSTGRSYTIRHIETVVTVGDVLGDIKQFRRLQREEDRK